MVPAAYQGFLTASTQASAALIGLLFVSISLAPERVFGAQSEAGRKAQALSAFSALANIFFISFASLIPDVRLGLVVVVAATVSGFQTLSLLFLLRAWHAEGVLWRSFVLLVGSGVVYGSELVVGLQLMAQPSGTGSLTGLLEAILGAYAIGLGRAWELLGAPRSMLLSSALRSLRRRRTPEQRRD